MLYFVVCFVYSFLCVLMDGLFDVNGILVMWLVF